MFSNNKSSINKLKVALVADWITNPGGDDKVIWSLHEIFPRAPIYTTIYDAKAMPHYHSCDIRTTYLNKLPLNKRKSQLLVPMMFDALRKFDFSDYDVIISSSHTVGKSINKPAHAIHICYCHTPLRYVWAPEIDDLSKRVKLGALKKPLLRFLKKKDLESAQSVDYFIANSRTIADRIKMAYGKSSTVIYPPVDVKKYLPDKKTVKKDYYFSAGRLIPYKKNDLIIRACQKLNKKLIIAGTGPELDSLRTLARGKTKLLGYIEDEKLIQYLQYAKALVFAADEDFGIVPVEAMAAGTPVVALGRGGTKETVVDGKTGILFNDQTVSGLVGAIGKLERNDIKASDCIKQSRKFDKKIFKEKIIKFVKKVAIGAK